MKMRSQGPYYFGLLVSGKTTGVSHDEGRSMRIETPQGGHAFSGRSGTRSDPMMSFYAGRVRRAPEFFSIFTGTRLRGAARPTQFNQDDLIARATSMVTISLFRDFRMGTSPRRRRGPMPVTVEFNRYLDRQSFAFDFHILLMTAFESCAKKDCVTKAERSARSSLPKTNSRASGPSRKLSNCSQLPRGLGRFPWY
jgi:hypothetical protein